MIGKGGERGDAAKGHRLESNPGSCHGLRGADALLVELEVAPANVLFNWKETMQPPETSFKMCTESTPVDVLKRCHLWFFHQMPAMEGIFQS